MARIFKPTYSKTNRVTGAKVTKSLKKWHVEYRDADGVVQKVPGFRDKKSTEQFAAELERRADRKASGLTDPFEERRKRPLAEHVADYGRELASRDNSPRYVAGDVSHITAVIDGCEFVRIADLSASGVMGWLKSIRDNGPRSKPLAGDKSLYTLAEASAALGMKPGTIGAAVRRNRLEAVGQGKARRFPRATIEALQDRQGSGVSVQTSNYCQRAPKIGHLEAPSK